MNPIEGIVLISIVAIIASVIKNKRKKPNDAPPQYQDDDTSKQMQLEMMALKKRVEALETIVTDKNYDLKREINQL
jgi:hypothetical protein